MDISNIMNKESHSVRSAKVFFVSSVGHNGLVDIGVLVVSIFHEPVSDLGNHKGDVLGVEDVVWVVTDA